MNEPEITQEVIESHGFTQSEYDMLLKIMGRTPTFTELGIFSVMWSEHCSYKNSKKQLKTLPTKGKQVLVAPGENAGVVDIGDGYAIAFKIESHNHPSAIEPYQGAATGIGGILRDIFTMGARPIALLDPLRFGNPDNSRTRLIINGVIKGIADYGNCVGVPTIGGDIYFSESYEGNPLINVMCVGLIKKENITTAGAKNVGDIVVYFGSTTGRDGIHGATFASVELSDETAEKRSSVQVGDPFMGKKILEATIELIESGVVSSIQDMGAAGLTCSSCEMASKGGCGIEVDLDKVPKRADKLTAYEIMLSESQERMLATIPPEKIEKAREILAKWELECCEVGKITDTGLMRVYHKGELKAEIPAAKIADDSPEYVPESKQPDYINNLKNISANDIKEPIHYAEELLKLLSSPTIQSKRWAYTQYDHQVQTNTVVKPGNGGGGVIRIRGTEKYVALTADCNGMLCYLSPYEGAKGAVAESSRNLVCMGAKPLAITNCLNFGNPTKPEIFWQFENCIKGMREACNTLNTPVTGGNVSFYNESYGKAVYPTPVIGMVGLIENKEQVTTPGFKNEGDIIYLIGAETKGLGGSQYGLNYFKTEVGPCPELDLELEKNLQNGCLEAIKQGLIESAQDCSEGGIAITLAESCILSDKKLGAQITYKPSIRHDEFLFSETQSRIVVSIKPEYENHFLKLCESYNVAKIKLGEVIGDSLAFEGICSISIDELKEKYYCGLKEL